MDIDPERRAGAARAWLDAVSAGDPEASGTDEADDVVLRALEPLGVDVRDPDVAPALAAAFDLLWFLVEMQAKAGQVDRLTLVSNLREHVLPAIYPDVVPE